MKKSNSLFYRVFVVVAVIQVAIFLGLSGYIITRTIINPEQTFEQPPEPAMNDVKQQENVASIKASTRKSSKMTKRISAATQNIQNADINIVLPTGTGGGMAGFDAINPGDMGKLDITMPELNFFNTKSKGERILICVDAGSHLMNEERGGLDTYRVIREEIKKLVDALPGTVFFNIMMFEIRSGAMFDMYKSGGALVPATDANKRGVASWIDPFNSSLQNIGVRSGNYTLKTQFLPQPPASNDYKWATAANKYRVYQAALEHGADLIYILTTDWIDPDNIKRPWTESETDRYRKQMEKYEADTERELKKAGWTEEKQLEYDKQYAKARTEAIAKARDWLEKENNRRKAKGESLYVGSPDRVITEQKFMPKIEPARPSVKVTKPQVNFSSYGAKGIANYYEPLFKDIYAKNGYRKPTINMIIFKGQKEEWTPAQMKIVRSFVTSHQNGNVQVLRGLKQVGSE